MTATVAAEPEVDVRVRCAGCGTEPDPRMTASRPRVPVLGVPAQTGQAILQGWYVTPDLTMCPTCAVTSYCQGRECETPSGDCDDCLTVLAGGELHRHCYVIRKATR